MARIALMTVSDGRESVHRDIEAFGRGVQDRVASALRDRGHDVRAAADPIWTNDGAVAIARSLADARPDLTVVNIPVWAFPHFTVLAARETPGPLLLFSNVDPQYRGWSACSPPGGRSTSSGSGTLARGATSAIRPWLRGSSRRRAPAARRCGCGAARSGGSVGGRWGCTPRSPAPTSG